MPLNLGELSLGDVGNLQETAVALALRSILEPQDIDGEVVAAFENDAGYL